MHKSGSCAKKNTERKASNTILSREKIIEMNGQGQDPAWTPRRAKESERNNKKRVNEYIIKGEKKRTKGIILISIKVKDFVYYAHSLC